jgi:hypothetical protein
MLEDVMKLIDMASELERKQLRQQSAGELRQQSAGELRQQSEGKQSTGELNQSQLVNGVKKSRKHYPESMKQQRIQSEKRVHHNTSETDITNWNETIQ